MRTYGEILRAYGVKDASTRIGNKKMDRADYWQNYYAGRMADPAYAEAKRKKMREASARFRARRRKQKERAA